MTPLRLSASIAAFAICLSFGIAIARPADPLAAATSSQPVDGAPALPDTPAGRCAAAWIALLRDGNADSARAFESTYASPKRLSERSLDERAARFPAVQKEFGEFRLREFVEGPDGTLTLYGDSSAGSTSLEFRVDREGKLDAVVISAGGSAGLKPEALTPAHRRELIEGVAKALRDEYVYPEKGAAMAEAIETALADGAYESIADEMQLAERLTADARAVTNDRHLRVRVRPAPPPGAAAESMGPSDEEARRRNWGFRECRIADGNVGVLAFDAFVPTEEAKRVVDAAMSFLARCDAIVFDLRQNGGGSPEMICYISGYLFDSPTLLNRMIARDGTVVGEAFSDEHVDGPRLPRDLPVFVVTSARTFSGAEEFSYNLQNLGRGTIVGETTGGGAHPIRPVRIDDRTIVAMPYMRAENPITHTNWEGTGVTPDVAVPAEQALDKAIELARERVRR